MREESSSWMLVDSADIVAEALEMQGYEMRVAYGPVSAISIAAVFQPQLAILDVDLPTMDVMSSVLRCA